MSWPGLSDPFRHSSLSDLFSRKYVQIPVQLDLFVNGVFPPKNAIAIRKNDDQPMDGLGTLVSHEPEVG